MEGTDANAEMAREMMHLDRLIRLHVGRDCTLIRRGHSFEVRRPCGTGSQLVARGSYDEVVAQITSPPAAVRP